MVVIFVTEWPDTDSYALKNLCFGSKAIGGVLAHRGGAAETETPIAGKIPPAEQRRGPRASILRRTAEFADRPSRQNSAIFLLFGFSSPNSGAVLLCFTRSEPSNAL
jgi:hypothetical protein